MTAPFARLLGIASACAALSVAAALPDEIQVYTSDINKVGEPGLELHVNTTPSGRSSPEFPGEIVPEHAWRITPEISYGITRTFEAGLYIPFVFAPGGENRLGGWKLRFKWLPVQTDEAGNGFFAGSNFEYAWLDDRVEEATRAFELRPIIGWRNAQWLFATNPILEFERAGPNRSWTPEFTPAAKVARTVAEGVAAGFEYYGDIGRTNNVLPRAEQSHTLYVALDVDKGPFPFNIAVGRGLNGATDRWTIKAIFEIPLGGK